ncbi:lipid kinase [Oscillatoria sp. FACHB-1406]|uniref:lipid kinase n=1 Tax=Oscillatoria sp. FACHB-1406 TaxID=2692846 RepID=UPI0016822F38|nr:lipid kinase [Oscillatoria sp. FACHB-1406]MBD2580348.1 lipid kinase [Oscillatoria sp. FACHB-1406]
MTEPKRALLLINPHARQNHKDTSGKGKGGRKACIRQLQAMGFSVVEPLREQSSDKHEQDYSELIRQYRHEVDLVIVGGGDGTLNSAIAGLIDTQLPLGILPLGTANDLARTLEIPNNIETACQIIAANCTRRIDVGVVNGQYFFNVASLGLSVKITKQLSKDAKRRWGALAYALTAFKVIARSRPFHAQIHCNDETYSVKTLQIAVGNGRYFGGGLSIVEDASISDRRLDLCSIEVEHWWQTLAILPALWKGQTLNPKWMRRLEGQHIEIHTRKHRHINTDGEITTRTPAQFKVVPEAINVFVPLPAIIRNS